MKNYHTAPLLGGLALGIIFLFLLWSFSPFLVLSPHISTLTECTITSSNSTSTLSITDTTKLEKIPHSVLSSFPIPCGIASGISHKSHQDSITYTLACSGFIADTYLELCSFTVDSSGFLYTQHLKYHLLNETALLQGIEDILALY